MAFFLVCYNVYELTLCACVSICVHVFLYVCAFVYGDLRSTLISLSFIPSYFVLEMRSLLKLEFTHVVRLAGQNNHKDSPSSRIKGTCYVPYIYMGSGTSALAFLLV